jgi:clusterin-associated protein 1
LSDDISTESERVRFLQAVAAITMSKTRTRLNLKKLYAADGAAVRELLKLAELLHKAMHAVSSYQEVCQPQLQLSL